MPFDAIVGPSKLAPRAARLQGSARNRRAYLPRHGTLVLDDAEGTVIAVERGCLWITLEHDLRDVILVPGMRFQVDRKGRTIVAAEEDSQLRVIRVPTAAERLTGWLRRAVSRGVRNAASRAAGQPVRYY